jgi:hypothetical protein
MNRLRARIRRAVSTDPEAGSVTLFVAITVVGLLVLCGLVADGGVKLRATQRVDSVAAEAARAGGQALDVPSAVEGNPLTGKLPSTRPPPTSPQPARPARSPSPRTAPPSTSP